MPQWFEIAKLSLPQLCVKCVEMIFIEEKKKKTLTSIAFLSEASGNREPSWLCLAGPERHSAFVSFHTAGGRSNARKKHFKHWDFSLWHFLKIPPNYPKMAVNSREPFEVEQEMSH